VPINISISNFFFFLKHNAMYNMNNSSSEEQQTNKHSSGAFAIDMVMPLGSVNAASLTTVKRVIGGEKNVRIA
jgi:hypothetical protein